MKNIKPESNRVAALGLVCTMLLTHVACDSHTNTGLELIPAESVTLSNEFLSIKVLSDGAIREGRLMPDRLNPDSLVSIVNSYGLWMSGSQEGISANIAGFTPFGINAYKFDESEAERAGLYFVTREDVERGISNWPAEMGAPSEGDSSPKLYGDVMAWARYENATVPYSNPNPFSGIVVGETVFTFNREPLRQVVFVRYDISNTSSKAVSDMYLGFGGDGDLFWFNRNGPSSKPCGDFTVTVHHNQVGYNQAKQYSYTYVKPDSSDGNLPSNCYGAMFGFSILDMQSANGLAQSKLAHRILNRWPEEPYVDFTETEIQTPEQVLLALQGLSSTGAPMIDPISGQSAAFAYTGDPVSGSGWIDIRKDVRSLQSISPFDLLPGETKVITVAIFTTLSPSFDEGIQDLGALFDTIMRKREDWDY